jgi:hypothetical protein
MSCEQGVVDLTGEVALLRSAKGVHSPHVRLLPLEIKTTRGRITANGSVAHRAQTQLYTLLLARRHSCVVDSGALLYIKTEHEQPLSQDTLLGMMPGRESICVGFFFFFFFSFSSSSSAFYFLLLFLLVLFLCCALLNAGTLCEGGSPLSGLRCIVFGVAKKRKYAETQRWAMVGIQAPATETVDILQARNRIAHYVELSSGQEVITLPELLPPSMAAVCKWCNQRSNCYLYHAALENGM